MTLLHSDYLKVLQNLNFYLDLGRLQSAEELLTGSLKEHGPDPRLAGHLGQVFYQQSKFKEALEQFQSAVSLNPTAPEYHLCLIAALCDLGFYQQASYAARELAANPGLNIPEKNPELLRRQAGFHERSGDHYERLGLTHQAVSEYQQALKLCDRLSGVRLKLADIFIRRDLFNEARKILEEARLNDPENCDIQVAFGLLYFRQGFKDQAKKAWEKAHHCTPSNQTAKAYYHLSKSWRPEPPHRTYNSNASVKMTELP